jgi:hypothetical protein
VRSFIIWRITSRREWRSSSPSASRIVALPPADLITAAFVTPASRATSSRRSASNPSARIRARAASRMRLRVS